jgi:hypothetical protein
MASPPFGAPDWNLVGTPQGIVAARLAEINPGIPHSVVGDAEIYHILRRTVLMSGW